MSEQPASISFEDLLLLFAVAADPRTCLLIGEVVKNGKRTEVARKRSNSLISLNQDAFDVLKETARVAHVREELRDPDEMVIRILRPQRES